MNESIFSSSFSPVHSLLKHDRSAAMNFGTLAFLTILLASSVNIVFGIGYSSEKNVNTERAVRDFQASFCESLSPSEYTLPSQLGNSNCYRIQVRKGGKLLVDEKDPGCAKFNAGYGFKGVPVSTYRHTDPGGIAVYKSKRWKGSIALLHDSSLSKATFEIEETGKLGMMICGKHRPAPSS